MSSTFTTNLGLNLQATGDNPNAWGGILNTQVFTPLDDALGTKLSLSVAGSSDVVLSTAQSNKLIQNYTGVLTGNINVIFPAIGGIRRINNNTTGSFTLSVKQTGGTAVLVPQGATMLIVMDGISLTISIIDSLLTTEATVTSATTTDLGLLASNVASITGTTTITAFGSNARTDRPIYFLRFTGVLTLTYNASSLILPGAANIKTAAGDTCIAKYEGSGNWRILFYQIASNDPLFSLNKRVTAQTDAANQTLFAPVTGLSASLIAGATYIIRAYLPTTAGAAGGLKISLDTSDSLTITSGSINGKNYNGTTINANSTATALATAVGAATAVTTDFYLNATLVVNAAGTLVLQMAQNVANGTTSSVLVNGYMAVQRIA